MPDDVASFKLGSTPDGDTIAANEVLITLHLVDNDVLEEDTDVIDISGERETTQTDLKVRYRLGTRTAEFVDEFEGDGGADGRWYQRGDGDARIRLDFVDWLPLEFIQRLTDPVPGQVVPPGLGTNTGDL